MHYATSGMRRGFENIPKVATGTVENVRIARPLNPVCSFGRQRLKTATMSLVPEMGTSQLDGFDDASTSEVPLLFMVEICS